ncbi:CDP-glycerol glycerophosphotransferase family protein [Paenisporosarcina sp. TG-14]|uniref:CDP-glycerol glycerophosphotransferase family protein n=1 Tax=Paenisporosarcina sp. TG-14 TaxID=1231057 RepID=UPI00030E39F9|nr:CDP-glycerol glycerophosphotransferase family protein [Paenisporosarcina sp. TG-14]
MKIKRVLNRLKKMLVKRVELKKHEFDGQELVFYFQLSNFFVLKKQIKAEFLVGEEVHTLPSKVTQNNQLTVRIPQNSLSIVDTTSTVTIKINGKTSWITKHPDYEDGDFQDSILFGNKYLTTQVKKNIKVTNRFADFFFMEKTIGASVSSAQYDTLTLKFDKPVPLKEEEVELYAFNNRQFRILSGVLDSSRQTAVIQNFQGMSAGLWRLFINIDKKLYPLSSSFDAKQSFESYHHKVVALNRYSSFCLEMEPHTLKLNAISISKTEDRIFRLSFTVVEAKPGTSYSLLVDEPKSGLVKLYDLEKQANSFTADLPADELLENLFVKRFFIVEQSDEPKVFRFSFERELLASSDTFYKVVFNSQFIKIKFYQRKDLSLGVSLTSSKLKKSIHSIGDFQIDGKIASIEEFIESTAYLLFEDRFSLESVQVQIAGEFNVNLSNLDLLGIKSKDKTVLDVFVIIENVDGIVIRKEKIRYVHAHYKKDNFYSHKKFYDAENNEHHFMITTTPYNNVKIETFTIKNHIQLPANLDAKDENVWLVGERTNTAQDNGIVFFQWLQKNTDIEAYYVIEEDSSDYEGIKHNPNVVAFGSDKHFEIAFKAKVLLCTHDFENILPYKPAKGFLGYENTVKVFLQHGVLGRKNVEYHKKNYDMPFDLFIVSSEPEKQVIVMDEMGYDDSEVAVTGLARFDNLVQQNKPKNILLMPTWRDWINTDEQFLNSEYFLSYTNLIQNTKLLGLLEEYNVNLNFYPHYRAQNYFQNEVDQLHEKIKFIPLGSQTVQQLLIDHALLITDYSSVSFDFTLLSKPVVYYHFDVDRFFRKGILRPVEETFIGGIGTHEEELVTIIEERIKNDFANFDYDITGIIKHTDQNNCHRTFNEVKKLLKPSTEYPMS